MGREGLSHIEPNTFLILSVREAYAEYIPYYEELLGVPNDDSTNSLVMCLGEITNMRGHYIFVNKKTGKIITGLHLEMFRMPTEDEI